MAATLMLAGQWLNNVERALGIVVTSENALFPKANLGSGWPGHPFRFNAAGANDAITIDKALYQGNLDGWSGTPSVPGGWTRVVTSPGDVTELTGADARSGSAARIRQSTGSALLRRDKTVRSGERLRIEAYMRKEAVGAGTAILRVQNPLTGKWLKSDGTWQATQQDLFSETLTTYQKRALGFTVESFAACLGPTTTLRIILTSSGTGVNDGGDFDDVYVWPESDWLSIHGHNLDPAVAVEWRDSSDNFAVNNDLLATVTKRQPSFWHALASGVGSIERWERVLFSGTNSVAIEVGELVLGQYLSLTRRPKRDMRVSREEAQIEGDFQVFQIRDRAARTVVLPFSHFTSTPFAQLRDEIIERCKGKLYPIVVQYDDEFDGEIVAHARMESKYEFSGMFRDPRESDIVVVENPFVTAIT